MKIDREWLKQNSTFPVLEDDVLDEFLDRAEERMYEDGDKVFAEMERFDEILLVVEGCLKHHFALSIFEEDPDELNATPGYFSNVNRFITDEPNTLGCTAVGNVKVLSWNVDSWKDICARHPEVGYKLAVQVSGILVQRLFRLNQILLDNISWGLE